MDTSMPNYLWHSSLLKMRLLKCAQCHKELQRPCPILYDIRHFSKWAFSNVHNVTGHCNVDAKFSVTFVTFENVSSKMCTMSQGIATSMPNSLWHSSLFKTNFLKRAHSHKELQRWCPNLCDIRHFWKLYFVTFWTASGQQLKRPLCLCRSFR